MSSLSAAPCMQTLRMCIGTCEESGSGTRYVVPQHSDLPSHATGSGRAVVTEKCCKKRAQRPRPSLPQRCKLKRPELAAIRMVLQRNRVWKSAK